MKSISSREIESPSDRKGLKAQRLLSNKRGGKELNGSATLSRGSSFRSEKGEDGIRIHIVDMPLPMERMESLGINHEV